MNKRDDSKHTNNYILMLLSIALLTLNGCQFGSNDEEFLVSIQDSTSIKFPDCDSFMAYYNSCQDYLETWPKSICAKEYQLNSQIPKENKNCYTKVVCDDFLIKNRNKIQECKLESENDARCILSVDLQCTDFKTNRKQTFLKLKNNHYQNMKNINVQLVTIGETVKCNDAQGDRHLESKESDIFTCNGRFDEAEILVSYLNPQTGTQHTKSGILIT